MFTLYVDTVNLNHNYMTQVNNFVHKLNKNFWNLLEITDII